MRTRIELHSMLEELMESDKVYFQPPASKKISYPCIIYRINKVNNTYSNNNIYKQDYFYELILVDSNPDSKYFHKLCKLPNCVFKHFYVSDNLNHFVFSIYAY